MNRHYESVILTFQGLYATHLRYKHQLEALDMEIRELEIALPEAEAEELELFKGKIARAHDNQ
jgi:hypothetical protein